MSFVWWGSVRMPCASIRTSPDAASRSPAVVSLSPERNRRLDPPRRRLPSDQRREIGLGAVRRHRLRPGRGDRGCEIDGLDELRFRAAEAAGHALAEQSKNKVFD
ncbi:hypothetical protein [Quisquiliibacterium transsilvanicum]|uniref:Uncharacterized protein n=1 Tax=Quisquiliibacterium transsilvanicum TaxID=1549638 RepID=A0A7W8HJL3_9BURK|nr:hypothetical protein [Quisquiliibacterium transsilvanicum]MBB5273230.1 hypothetical protein [Quisquiliibacterium transsilvanicum]